MNANYWLVVSSLSFIAPSIVSYKTYNYDITALYIMITITSSYYHYSKNPYLLYMDYALNQITHITTLHRILPGGWRSMSAYSVWVSYILFIYYYGNLTQTLVWNPNIDEATAWHMTLHMSTAITSSYTLYTTYLIKTTEKVLRAIEVSV